MQNAAQKRRTSGGLVRDPAAFGLHQKAARGCVFHIQSCGFNWGDRRASHTKHEFSVRPGCHCQSCPTSESNSMVKDDPHASSSRVCFQHATLKGTTKGTDMATPNLTTEGATTRATNGTTTRLLLGITKATCKGDTRPRL